jgi:hypothetical protein
MSVTRSACIIFIEKLPEYYLLARLQIKAGLYELCNGKGYADDRLKKSYSAHVIWLTLVLTVLNQRF